MPKLIYSVIMSLDGYNADREGNFDWGMPDEAVHAFINRLLQPVGTYLYGRRMYAVMAAWEDPQNFPQPTPAIRDFAVIWRAAEKIVYSRTLAQVSSARTRLEREFDPQAIRELKKTRKQDLAVGGPELAAQAFQAGLVDECQLFLAPVVVGGGKRALPEDLRLRLELLEQRRFGNGMVFLRYRTRV